MNFIGNRWLKEKTLSSINVCCYPQICSAHTIVLVYIVQKVQYCPKVKYTSSTAKITVKLQKIVYRSGVLLNCFIEDKPNVSVAQW